MGYEMTRPAQKWLGIGLLATSFLLMLFTLAVPYVNHFGYENKNYTYFTRWNGKWREGTTTVYQDSDTLLNFPKSAPVFIGMGLVIALIGATYLFWLTYSNKPCYILRERPGPIGGSISLIGIIMYLIGNLIYFNWASGAPRPAYGWPVDSNFSLETVKLSTTFWFGIVLALAVLAFCTMNIVYYLDTRSKRPVK